jgi:hypothetical protein
LNDTCSLTAGQLFPNGGVFMIGVKIITFSPSSSSSVVKETFIKGTDEIGFIKQINKQSRNVVTRAFVPGNIKYKALIIDNQFTKGFLYYQES